MTTLSALNTPFEVDPAPVHRPGAIFRRALIVLTILASSVAAVAQPANDDCFSASFVGPGTVTANNIGATTELAVTCAPSHGDVWYLFVAPFTSGFVFDTEGSAQADMVLALFDACGGTELACDDDSGTGTQSSLAYLLSGGQSVRIRVATYGASGSLGPLQLNITPSSATGACCDGNCCTVVTPASCIGTFLGAGVACSACSAIPNDACSTPIQLLLNVPVAGSTCSAANTDDGPPPACVAEARHAVWFAFTPASTATYQIATCGSFQDTVLSLLTSSDCVSFTALACDDDSCDGVNPPGATTASRIDAMLTAGQQYLIRVQSYGPLAPGGSFLVGVSGPPEATGACCLPGGDCMLATASGCTSLGGTYSGDGTDCGGGIICIEYGACCRPGGGCFEASRKACEGCVGGGGTSGKYKFIPNAACNGDNCPTKLALCCPSGSCTLVDASTCTLSTGISFNGTCGPSTCGTPLENNPCAAARVLPAPGDFVATTVGATPDLMGSPCGVQDDRDVWFSYTPAATATHHIQIDRAGELSLLDSTLAVYTACGGAVLACNDDGPSGPMSELTIELVAGTNYKIRVAGNNHSMGAFVMHLKSLPAGACCEPNGGCYLAPMYECVSPWIFLGAGTVCSPETCPCPTPAEPCCLDDGPCPGVAATLLQKGCDLGDTPMPGAQLASQQNAAGFVFCSGGRGFRGSAVNQPFCHTFSGLPSNIATAAVQLNVRANAGDACDDRIDLHATGVAAAPFAWGRQIGTSTTVNCGSNVSGLLSALWVYPGHQILCLNLNALENADGSTTNLVPMITSSGRLDIHLQDDTSVDWIRLWYTLDVSCCPADVNDSGQLSVQDIFDFLMAFFSGGEIADFNQDGNTSVQDLFDFLESYFTGCP